MISPEQPAGQGIDRRFDKVMDNTQARRALTGGLVHVEVAAHLDYHRGYPGVRAVEGRRHYRPGKGFVTDRLETRLPEDGLRGLGEFLRRVELVGTDADFRAPEDGTGLIGKRPAGRGVEIEDDAATTLPEAVGDQAGKGVVMRFVEAPRNRLPPLVIGLPERPPFGGPGVDRAHPHPAHRLLSIVPEALHVANQPGHGTLEDCGAAGACLGSHLVCVAVGHAQELAVDSSSHHTYTRTTS